MRLLSGALIATLVGALGCACVGIGGVAGTFGVALGSLPAIVCVGGLARRA